MLVTFPAHFVNHYLIILIICGETDTSVTLLIAHFSSISFYFLQMQLKYSIKHSVVQYPQSVYFS